MQSGRRERERQQTYMQFIEINTNTSTTGFICSTGITQGIVGKMVWIEFMAIHISYRRKFGVEGMGVHYNNIIVRSLYITSLSDSLSY